MIIDVPFSKREDFTCSCGCNKNNMSKRFLQRIDAVEVICGFKLKLRSGFRCPKYERQIEGSGNHTRGVAVDVEARTGWHKFQIMDAARKVGFVRIGVGGSVAHA